jgi:hypothetical protein
MKSIDMLWTDAVTSYGKGMHHKFLSVIMAICIMLLLSPYVLNITSKAHTVYTYHLISRKTDFFNYQTHKNTECKEILNQFEFLSDPENAAADIYVFDSRVYYYLTKRYPSIRLAYLVYPY